MPYEIERKFLVKNDTWRAAADGGTRIQQGFLNTDKERTVRVRIYGDKALLTIKGKTTGASKLEFEYPIPMPDAAALLGLCHRPLIEKTRYLLRQGGLTWEIDVFGGDNEGLRIAEVELQSETQEVPLPDWAGDEVTQDFRYYNSNLSKRPYKDWE